MSVVKTFEEITNAEWLCWEWVEVTEMQDSQQRYLRVAKRPVDEAAKLAGSMKDLEPYMWAYGIE